MGYIYQVQDWPHFKWNMEALATDLAEVRHGQGFLAGRMSSLGAELQVEANVETLATELVRSCAIEGEKLDASQVRSSLARRLGLESGTSSPRYIEGLVEMMLDVTENYAAPITAQRLWSWQASLFPSGFSGLSRIVVGAWRTGESGPMKVISGPLGRERVHFEAPTASLVAPEMERFIEWVNDSRAPLDPVLKAAIAHLWFITIHPFEDGNGRIARALTELLLARADNCPQRFYSLSSQIEKERRNYYNILESSQKGDLDITPWLSWFVSCLGRAVAGAEDLLQLILTKNTFWREAEKYCLNDRQKLVLGRLLGDFTGKLTSSKYAKLAKCSPDTALRDLKELMGFGLMSHGEGGGRSTHYQLSNTDSSSGSL